MLFLTQGRQVMAAAEVPAQRRGHERIRDRKRGALDLWKLVGPHLTPGPYFVDHLGHLRHVLHGRWLTDVAKAKEASGAAGLPGALRRTLKWTVAAASPPTLLWLSRTEATRLGEGQLGVFALPTAGGNAVLLARDGTSIVRVYRGGTVSPSEARLRPILERHLRLTPAGILEGDGLIIEPYVRGRNYSRLPAHSRQDIYRRLILGYADMVAKHALAPEPNLARPSADVLERSVAAWRFPADMGRIAWDHLHEPVPCAPSHGDVYSDNLLVREDGSFALIDFERCAAMPFYYDVLNLALCESKEGRHDLAAGLIGGSFDAEYGELWAAAGIRYSRAELWRALSAAFLLHLSIWSQPRHVDWSELTREGSARN